MKQPPFFHPEKIKPKKKSRRLIFVALGDSLTLGFQSPKINESFFHYQPYTRFLEEMVSLYSRTQHCDIIARFFNEGRNGDSTFGMLSRFKASIVFKKPDYVIVWGGINDLITGESPEIISNNLKKIYERIKQIGAKPIACNLTPIEGLKIINHLIQEVNLIISKHCKVEKILLIDLYSATVNSKGELKSEFSNDGVHLSTKGYNTVAITIFRDAIKDILAEF